MRPTPPRGAVAVLCGDLHFSHKPPLARSLEPDWYATQANYCRQLREIVERESWESSFRVPLICSGDVFDTWNQPPELINMLIRELPNMFAVPGQHDLPYHRYEDIRRSAYWTLVGAGVITDLKPGEPVSIGWVRLHGFPWGFDPQPMKGPHPTLALEVAVCHRYLWTRGTGYEGAPEDRLYKATRPLLEGYNVAHFGDNHQTIVKGEGEPAVFNAGSFMRRKADEKDHRPCVGLVYADGSIVAEYLDTSGDKILNATEVEQVVNSLGAETLVETVMNLADAAVDFGEVIDRLLERKKVPDRVKQLVHNYIRRGDG